MLSAKRALLPAVLAGVISIAVPHATTADRPVERALNDIRVSASRAPLQYSTVLERVARRHAEDISRRRALSHIGADGSRVSHRASAEGYPWCQIAENVAWGQQNLDQVMRDWKRSPSHRRAMLSANVVEFGLARADGDFWVMVLARPGCTD